MAKVKSVFICRECGAETTKWNGRCPSCGEWNTLEETESVVSSVSSKSKRSTPVKDISDSIYSIGDVEIDRDEVRYKTGLNELDRVLGGGLVKGSLVLLGGEPGIGKSTLLLQICQHLG